MIRGKRRGGSSDAGACCSAGISCWPSAPFAPSRSPMPGSYRRWARQVSTPAVDRDLVGKATWIVGCLDKIDLISGCPFLLRLLESLRTEGSLDLAESGRRGRGPFRPPFAGAEGIVDLDELCGRHRACPLDQVVPAQGGQPGARGKARAGERDAQHAFKGQSFLDADCHFGPQAGDVGVRRGDDLHCPEPGRLVVRQQHNRPWLVELGPPDLASVHVSSWHETAGGCCAGRRWQ